MSSDHARKRQHGLNVVSWTKEQLKFHRCAIFEMNYIFDRLSVFELFVWQKIVH